MTRLPDVLRRAVLGAPADAAGDVLADTLARETGASSVEVLLVDRAGRALHRVGAAGGCADDDPALDAEAAAALRGEVVAGPDGTVHVPLLVRGGAQGLLRVAGAGRVLDDEAWRDVGELTALLLSDAGRVTDFFEARRRSASFSVSAELQWQLLPSTSLVTGAVELHALIEPAPRVTSDLFDWSLDGPCLWLAVLDAEGRGLSAASTAAVAVAALRHARRTGVPLDEQVALAGQALYDRFRGGAVVHAVVLTLDVVTGAVTAVRTGDADVAPRVFRRRTDGVEEVVLEAQEGLGALDRSPYVVEASVLGPDEQLLVVTDGGPGARDASGGPFGVDRVAGRFRDATALVEAPRRLLDALRTHSAGELEQDATALVVGRRAG